MSASMLPATPLKSTQYTLEPCAGCQGTGLRCLACDGNGFVLVQAPAVKCSRCLGSGIERNRPASASPVCVSCAGVGWDNIIRTAR